MEFTWNSKKASANRVKHGITFEEAASVFEDPNVLILEDIFDGDEQRFRALGMSFRLRILVVIFVERAHNAIRIISARKAVKHEIKQYTKNKSQA